MPLSERARVLVADAKSADRDRVRESLAVSSVDLVEAGSMAEALEQMEKGQPDLVITELELPDASGFVLCRRMRERPDDDYVPVIVISTWTGENDRILAFECGADDFVAKPFFARELSSRVDAVLRRSRDRLMTEATEPASTARTATALASGRRPREVLFDGHPLPLTPKERALLGALAHAGGRVLSREDLIEQVWGGAAAPTSRSVDSHIKSLRRKLGEAPDCVETVRGVGYRFAPHPQLELR